MKFDIEKFKTLQTPFYYYDLNLLNRTLHTVKENVEGYPYEVHYALKANVNPMILEAVRNAGLGIDCVSGGELNAALKAGFKGNKIVFAGVAKTDKEINAGLDANIECFNVESINELEVINELAIAKGKIANVAIRINPNIDAHTHHYITTGLNENKFGISLDHFDKVLTLAESLPNINLCGLHFHIGSQIKETEPFEKLCEKINELQERAEKLGITFSLVNVGGGLGIDYEDPENNPIPDFKGYFDVFKKTLQLRKGQKLHFELGRSIVAQCGALITKVIYVKEGVSKKFVIVDAGMSDLIRPALYQAHHNIVNLTSESSEKETYDVVGPICESSDTFGTGENLPITKRGDIMALLSAGAYGEIMASHYNCREFPGSYASE